MVKSDFLESFARRMLRLQILTMIDDAELRARVSRARASLVVNPISGRHYGDVTEAALGQDAETPR